MATSYALPLNGSATHSHGHGHTRSHHRKAVPDRLALAPPGSLNSMMQIASESSAAYTLNRQHMHSRSMPPAPDKQPPKHEHSHSTYEPYSEPFPSAGLSSADMNHRQHTLDSDSHTMEGRHGLSYISTDGYEPSPRSQAATQRVMISVMEVASSLLIPLPFALVTLVLSSQVLKLPVDPTIAKLLALDKEKADMGRLRGSAWLSNLLASCALTSMTLLLVGITAKLQRRKDSAQGRNRAHSALGPRNAKTKTDLELLTLESVWRTSGRVASVGLPFLAACTIGGEQVAVLSLVAAAADLAGTESLASNTTSRGWRRLLHSRKWTLLALIVQILMDVIGLTSTVQGGSMLFGYLAIGASALFLPPPYPSSSRRSPGVTSPIPKSTGKTSAVPIPWDASRAPVISPRGHSILSPLISTPKDVNLTLCAGILTAVPCALWALLHLDVFTSSSLSHICWGILASGLACISLMFATPKSLNTERKLGLAVGLFAPMIIEEMLMTHVWGVFAFQGVVVTLFWAAIRVDTHSALANSHSASPVTHRHVHASHEESHSRITGMFLSATEDWPLLHKILAEKDSRRIFYFMGLNFAFMIVQTCYGFITGSLGLLSDSIHMFFDCVALVVGLCAAVMSKWPPSIQFPYGYGKMDTLAGFANGVFLMLISVEIIYEAIERLVEGSEMQRLGELLTVSSLGLIVNLVGMYAFGHAGHNHSGGGHSHSRGGHDHSHDKHDHSDGHAHSHSAHDHCNKEHDHDHEHSNTRHSHSHHHENRQPSHSHSHITEHDNNPISPLPFSVPPTPSAASPPKVPTHSHHHHGHDHGNENMHGIFLHVMADTLGSVAVVVSTILIHYTGWVGFDPLASCLIAIAIFAAAVPLVSSTAKRLLLTVPGDTEFDLREALAGVGGLRGVVGVSVPRFWMGEGDGGRVGGVMHVIAGRGVELEDVRERAVRYLEGNGMDVLVQVEREGEGRCWCGGSNSTGSGALGVAPGKRNV
ncbi:putative zinc transporter msc2 [Trapelia coarctata]|nr:putative zinc transporter msc2 [Trapelia coarctata]